MYVIRFVTDIRHSDGEKESEMARKVKLSCMKEMEMLVRKVQYQGLRRQDKV